MEEITVKRDKTCQGSARRYTIGKPSGPLTGAIYVKAGVEVPKDGLKLVFAEDKEDEDAPGTSGR